jgi:hypothetical protein
MYKKLTTYWLYFWYFNQTPVTSLDGVWFEWVQGTSTLLFGSECLMIKCPLLSRWKHSYILHHLIDNFATNAVKVLETYFLLWSQRKRESSCNASQQILPIGTSTLNNLPTECGIPSDTATNFHLYYVSTWLDHPVDDKTMSIVHSPNKDCNRKRRIEKLPSTNYRAMWSHIHHSSHPPHGAWLSEAEELQRVHLWSP